MNRLIFMLLLRCVILTHAFDSYYATSFQSIGDQVGLDWGIFDQVLVLKQDGDFQTQSDNPNSMEFSIASTLDDEDDPRGASV